MYSIDEINRNTSNLALTDYIKLEENDVTHLTFALIFHRSEGSNLKKHISRKQLFL